jgi:predicted RNA-binding protein YlxR (DUF448 family)/ribosomal protein L30E
LGCRVQKEKEKLIRFSVSFDGSLLVGLEGGRGAYLCPNRSCVRLALKRRAFQHALRTNIDLPTEEDLLRMVRLAALRKIASLLGLARRAGKVAFGLGAAEGAVRGGAARLLLIAADAPPGKSITLQAAARSVPALLLFTQGELGAAFGKEAEVAVAIKDPHFAHGILRYAGRIPLDVESSQGTAGEMDERR